VAVQQPIRVMLAEHDRAGELLERLRAATSSFAVPDDACASYRSLYERLEALELDTHLHVHKENHALFPAALALVS
jgi:regulator of cell morphogenesis and NO signaling